MDIDTRMIQMMQEMMKIRGSIIERITISEMLLNIVLAKYYTENKHKQDELIETLFATNKITFDSKRDTLVAILKNSRFDNFLHKKRLCALLIDVIPERNVFAHYTTDGSEESLDSFKHGIFTFMKFKNERGVKKYSTHDIQKIEKKIIELNELLSNLIEKH